MTTEELLARLDRVKGISGGFMCRCPNHDDQTASLSVSPGPDGKILLHCHAGCEPEAIMSALGLTLADLFPPREVGGRREPTATYDYRDERGELLYQACRYPADADGKKHFSQRHPDGLGSWIWKMNGVRRVPYHLDQIQHKDAIIIVEGEKDADRLWSLRIPATTNSGGAGKWTEDHTRTLKAAGAKRVAVLADNDPPGEAHALMVARSCDDAGLFTKRILLPGLPDKGDVSDWLDAGHTKAELLDIIKNAPPFNAHALVAQRPKLALTTLSDLLMEPEALIEWVVDDRIPSGGLVLLAGKPKAGKSTLARSLAYCVASGTPWMGHHVTVGPVWYLALEDKRSELRRHFLQMGATGQEPLWIFAGDAPAGTMAMLEERAKTEQPILIIVDTLQRLIQAKDMNDYAEVTTKFAPLLTLTRQTGAALVAVHHAKKFGEGMDAVLGSTALSGSVDNIFVLSWGERDRALQSYQRIGDHMEATVVELDQDTGLMVTKGSKRLVDINRAADLILEALREEPNAQQERWLREHVEAAPKIQVPALRMLLRMNRVYRIGCGRRGDPYMYGIMGDSERTGYTGSSGFDGSDGRVPPREKTRIQENPKSSLTSTVRTPVLDTAERHDEADVDDSLFANPEDDHDHEVH